MLGKKEYWNNTLKKYVEKKYTYKICTKKTTNKCLLTRYVEKNRFAGKTEFCSVVPDLITKYMFMEQQQQLDNGRT